MSKEPRPLPTDDQIIAEQLAFTGWLMSHNTYNEWASADAMRMGLKVWKLARVPELLARVEELEEQLTSAQSRVAGHIEHIKSLEAEVAKLRSIKFKRFSNQDYWIYQGDGSDHLESLVCPVVMSAQQVAEFEKAQNRVGELERDRETVLNIVREVCNNPNEVMLGECVDSCDDVRSAFRLPVQMITRIKAAIESQHDAT